MSNPASCCIAAVTENNIVGYAAGYLRIVLTQCSNVAYLDELVVAPSHQKNGVGTELMHRFEQWAQTQSCTVAGLASGGARAFYEQLGYESNAGYYKKVLASQQ